MRPPVILAYNSSLDYLPRRSHGEFITSASRQNFPCRIRIAADKAGSAKLTPRDELASRTMERAQAPPNFRPDKALRPHLNVKMDTTFTPNFTLSCGNRTARKFVYD